MKKSIYILPIVAVLAGVLLFFGTKKNNPIPYQKNSGLAFGTSYNITYQSEENFEEDIKKVLNDVDMSLSPFNKESIITAVNNNNDVTVDDYFSEVFTLAKTVSANTNGAFDITVAPLVNIWGFGFKAGKWPTPEDIDSIRTFVGFEKVSLQNEKVTKKDPRTMLDCSAIAKGFAVDKVAEMLASKDVKNFLVEIGGEIVARGHNPHNKVWSIGVVKPHDDSLSVNSEMQTILNLSNIAMATSGDYRNYYIKDGHKYAHTINPKSGYPAEQNILSATVMAPTCAEADAYATAFMTMGMKATRAFLNTEEGKHLKVYLIYTEGGKNKVWQRM